MVTCETLSNNMKKTSRNNDNNLFCFFQFLSCFSMNHLKIFQITIIIIHFSLMYHPLNSYQREYYNHDDCWMPFILHWKISLLFLYFCLITKVVLFDNISIYCLFSFNFCIFCTHIFLIYLMIYFMLVGAVAYTIVRAYKRP